MMELGMENDRIQLCRDRNGDTEGLSVSTSPRSMVSAWIQLGCSSMLDTAALSNGYWCSRCHWMNLP